MATKKAAKAKRTRIYVVQQPGPGKLWHYWLYYANGAAWQEQRVRTQRETLLRAIESAKAYQPSTIYVQRKNGSWREVRSYPAVVNRKVKK